MYVTAIVLAAGKGLRLKSKISKPLIKINSKPLIIYSLNVLGKHPYIKDIIVVANPENLEDIGNAIKLFRIDKIKGVVLGGEERQASVANGLRAMDNHTDLVLIHDAARTFIDKDTVSSVIKTAKSSGAAIVGVPVKATIKEVTSYQLPVTSKYIVKKTLDRSKLWEIQTPQVFNKSLILKAYDKFGDIDVTDDAMLVEKLGVKVSVVLGTYNNIKITTPEDLIVAQAIAKKLIKKRN
ncbi:MAG: 2-C-methyl-D-erythritol 4-phosphate cytidylyltransferase [Candidatus Omnitrophota bacterium]|nr:2-C-methyl-D-erythritol 4-phosphate cytidylyltransferase [Candidatus Omnitrophota bacterium]